MVHNNTEIIAPPCWILCNPRTGSSYLCELLNSLNLAEFQHAAVTTYPGPTQGKRAFGEWLRLYTNREELLAKPPAYLKCIHHQFADFEISRQNIESKLAGIKFILLQRTDRIQHAASIYFAKQTNRYHIYNQKQLNNYLSQNIEWNDIDIMKAYGAAIIYTNNWSNFLNESEYYTVNYEDLINSPATILCSICDYLGVPVPNTIHHQLLKMQRPEINEFAVRLQALLTQQVI